ncbi:MAG: glycoside hydrolase family 172 protein [Kiritimatiellia bacterium]
MRFTPYIKFWLVSLCFTLSFFLAGQGCSKKDGAAPAVNLENLTRQLGDLDRLARLDAPAARIETSFDRTGKNDDFNFCLRRESGGWAVLADLKGPAYVSRFWFTGAENGQHPLRFYFDNEKKPRIETTIGDFCGGKAPFLPPLAAYEPFCWFSFVPLPFNKRLIITTKEGGFKAGGNPKLFFQVNYCPLHPGTAVESFPKHLSAAESNELIQAGIRLKNISGTPNQAADVRLTATNVTILPGQTAVVLQASGPAIIRELRLTPDLSAVPSASKRNEVMYNTVLRAYWDNSGKPSVEVPLGNFFGSFWQLRQFSSACFGASNRTFYSRFPMPFASAARIEIQNGTDIPLAFESKASMEKLSAWTNSYGYFHSGWTKSGPQDAGKPHRIVMTEGRGRVAGCILAVTSLDQSWWILEGDETMRIDGESFPSWHGTGLEDYFNGGWYYGNAIIRAFHGLILKAFFTTIQYRIHHTDPVAFEKSVDFSFERGPDHASRGFMESVSFYYLTSPAGADSDISRNIPRTPPEDPFAQVSVMMALNELERLGDFAGAADYIDSFLEKYPAYPYRGVLRLRQTGYLEKEKGFAAAKGRYEQFRSAETNAMARQMADMILWYNSSPSNAILGVYCNMRTGAYMDGRFIGEAGAPERMQFFGLQLPPGKHALALQCVYRDYPYWVQACLRTHGGDFYTSPRWKYAYAPPGNWSTPDYDDSAWIVTGGIEESKGPPVDPYIWLEPHPFVGMQTAAKGIWVTNDWPDKKEKVVFRTKLDIP